MRSDRSKGSVIGAILLVSIMLLGLLPGPVSGQSDFEIRLYMHKSPKRLDTIQPTAAGGLPTETLRVGTDVNYPLSYALTRDITISGTQEGGVSQLLVHLQDTTPTPGSSNLVLTIKVYMDMASGSSLQIAARDVQESELAEDDFKVPFTSADGAELSEGSKLRLLLSLNGTGPVGLPASITFAYLIAGGGSSYIAFTGEPIPEDGVMLAMKDANGATLDAIIPNGPEEAREVTFQCSAADVFGAYDISTISLLVRSDGGSILLNQSTDQPTPSGGEDRAYFNTTYTFPLGTPTGTYQVIVQATSSTGYTMSVTGELIVREGLFLTLEQERIEVDAGETAVFELEVLNGGDSNDRITFTATSDKGWTVEVPQPEEVGGGEKVVVEFKVLVPLRAGVSTESNITMEAESRNAGESYSKSGSVFVKGAATFGVELAGSSSTYVFAGDRADFSVKVINLEDSQRTFEMSPEELPAGWSASYSGANGTAQGSLYTFTVAPLGETTVMIGITSSPSYPGGSEQVKVYVRPPGESEKRYVYMNVHVVDPAREVVYLVGGTDTKAAARKGSAFPVEYSTVSFAMELYNPSLSGLSVDIEVGSIEGWKIEYDYSTISLLPGELSNWSIRITPEKGALWNNGNSYTVKVDIDASAQGQSAKSLKVVLPRVDKVEALPEATSIQAKEGQTVPLNITMVNLGNTDGTVDVTVLSPPELVVTISPSSKALKSGEEQEFSSLIKVGDISKEEVLTVTVEYLFNEKKEEIDISVSVVPAKDDKMNPLWIIIGGAVLIIVIAAGLVLYLKFGRRRSKKEPAEEKKPVQEVKVEASPEAKESPAAKTTEKAPPPGPSPPKPREPAEEDVEAQRVMEDLLGGKEAPVQTEEVVLAEAVEEGEVIEAKLVE